MKRSCCFLLVVICVIVAICASAEEEFTLRNGIHFNDPVEKVLELETLSMEKYKNNSEKHGGDCYIGTGTIVNVELSRAWFYFNSKGALQEMMYDLLAAKDGGPFGFAKLDSAKQVYDNIYDTLISKYGDPLQLEKGKTSLYHAAETYDRATAEAIIDLKPRYTSEWLIPSANDYVKIDLYLCDCHDSWNRVDTYRLLVGYAFISHEEMEETYQQHQQDIDKQEQNMNNDL